MKKTLLITHEYYPFTGGVARYCYNLFKYFPKEKYLVVSDHAQVQNSSNIIHLKFKDKFVYPSWFLGFFRIKKIIKENKIEQIFTPNILPLGSMAYLFFKFYKIPYIISLHGLDINNALKNKASLTKKILANAKVIIVNSRYTADLLQPLALNTKVEIIYPSLDGDQNKGELKAIRQQYGLSATDKVLLTVGRLNYRKGHDLILRALAELQRPELKYLIVGQGQEKENLQALVQELKLDSQVIFCGVVSDVDLESIYAGTDIFVLPNRSTATDVEGFGIVFLEAASHGLAIIAGNSGGVTEILTDKVEALLIPSDDEQALANALSKLLGDAKLVKNLGQAALLRSQAFASSKIQSDKLEKILN